MEQDELKKILEALLFITDQPITIERIAKVTEVSDKAQVRAAVAELQTAYLEGGRSIQIVEVAGGFQMSTKPEYGRYVRKLYNERMTSRLSVAAMETLAIIAYRQPITRAEVETIRGVEVIAPLETILERGLVKVVGRKETVGRPLLYGTTDEFLRVFGLNSLEDLPKLESLELKPAEMPQPELPLGADGQPPVAPVENGTEAAANGAVSDEAASESPAAARQEASDGQPVPEESSPAAEEPVAEPVPEASVGVEEASALPSAEGDISSHAEGVPDSSEPIPETPADVAPEESSPVAEEPVPAPVEEEPAPVAETAAAETPAEEAVEAPAVESVEPPPAEEPAGDEDKDAPAAS